MIPIHFDMETSDPDDAMTLAILATHPKVNLVGVSVTPGGSDQVSLVREILNRLGVKALVGNGTPKPDKKYVSEFHRTWLGDITASGESDGPADCVMGVLLVNIPDIHLLTGARLTNVAEYLSSDSARSFASWVGQGGFAGDSVVPEEHRLPKFIGRETCPTFNFNGDPAAAFDVLGSNKIKRKTLVSKNVCHGVAWDRDFHELIRSRPMTDGMKLVFRGMSSYLSKKSEGKLLHDPLAACVLLDPDVIETREVEVYRAKGEWGSRLVSGKPDPVHISVAVDKNLFFDVLSAV